MSSHETVDVFKQFITNYERKLRNLLKRKGKLDSYRERLHRGESLNEEQRKAVEGYDEVSQNISFVQELIKHSNELVKDVESSVCAREKLIETEHEQHTLSIMRIYAALMRLFNALDIPAVRTAVIRFSSENHLKLLEIVRTLITAPLLDDWPGNSATALGNAYSYLENHPSLHLPASSSYDLAVGRNKPIPMPENGCCSLKKHSFKEVRALCFRLLGSPVVQRAMGMTGSEPSVSPVEVVGCTTDESTDQTQGDYVSVPLDVKTESVSANGNHIIMGDLAQNAEEQSVPKYLNNVIKPFATTFNFLQASKVINRETESHANPAVGFVEEIANRLESNPPNVSADQLPTVNLAVDVHYPENYKPDVADRSEAAEKLCLDNRDGQPSDVLPPVCDPPRFSEGESAFGYTTPVSPGKISYADLLRRPSAAHAVAANTSNVETTVKRDSNAGHVHPTCITFEPAEPNHTSHFDQQTSGRPGPSRGNRTRGFYGAGRGNGGSGFQSGSAGNAHRRGGSIRGGRNQSGRGSGGYRGMRPGLAQATY